jgi:hypothetical protein
MPAKDPKSTGRINDGVGSFPTKAVVAGVFQDNANQHRLVVCALHQSPEPMGTEQG